MSIKKVVIFGEEAVGKTSIVMTSCFGYKYEEIEKLQPTKGVSIEKIDFRALENFRIWDCAGQESYLNSHFSETGKLRIFSSIDAAVFVMDASRPETLDPKYAKEFLETLRKFNPKLEKVYVFINKMDIAPHNINDYITALVLEFKKGWDDGFVNIVNCSVKFGNAKEKFIHILDSLIYTDEIITKKQKFFVECLSDFREVVDGDFSLFETYSGLMIANLFSEENLEQLSYGYEIIDNIKDREKKGEVVRKHTENNDGYSYIFIKIIDRIAILIMTELKTQSDIDRVVMDIKKHPTYSDLSKIFTL